MWKALVMPVSGLASALLCAVAGAQQLPKSGSISIHTGFKVSGEAMEVAAKRPQGHGTAGGVSFNDNGSGPLHRGPATCFYTFFANEGGGAKNKGYCAFGDADGDRIFTDWTGTISADGQGNGVNEIAGGTGKYTGIQGSGPWKCRDVGPNGQHDCTQRFDYRLP